MKTLYYISFVLLLPAILITFGCGDSKSPAKVTGTITLNGNPLAGAEVTFTPDDGTRISQGNTDDKGKYELWFSATANGAAVGTHRVSIRVASSDAYVPPSRDSDVPPPPRETIPSKYNTETELTATLKRGKQVVNFDLITP
jgi:hypothetical protein